MKIEDICAVIPAAGRGSRLGLSIPKILAPVVGDRTIWDILYSKLAQYTDRVHVVLSPEGFDQFNEKLRHGCLRSKVTTSVQVTPKGMGDAIFSACDFWRGYRNILVVWGDQVFLSDETIQKTVNTQCSSSVDNSHILSLPLTEMDQPYVQYLFDDHTGHLQQIRQSREGDLCDSRGFSDVGLFGLSVDGLESKWKSYLTTALKGNNTGEINFLPFLVELSNTPAWRTKSILVKNSTEARGVNTPQDLEFFRKLETI